MIRDISIRQSNSVFCQVLSPSWSSLIIICFYLFTTTRHIKHTHIVNSAWCILLSISVAGQVSNIVNTFYEYWSIVHPKLIDFSSYCYFFSVPECFNIYLSCLISGIRTRYSLNQVQQLKLVCWCMFLLLLTPDFANKLTLCFVVLYVIYCLYLYCSWIAVGEEYCQ